MVIKMKYFKYNALGNSFILINKTDSFLSDKNKIEKLLSKDIGIGADGLLIIDKINNSIEFYNSDGTKANFCGNGIRAYFAYIYKFHKEKQRDFIKINFGNVLYSGKVIKEIDEYNYQVTVKVKNKNFDIRKIKYETDEFTITGYETKIGVDHFIIFKNDNLNLFQELINNNKKLDKIQKSNLFYETPNIDLVEKVKDNEFLVKTYERGVGFTSSCGSGALACAYVCSKIDERIKNYKIISKYGKSKVKISNSNLILTGPLTLVSIGEYFG